MKNFNETPAVAPSHNELPPMPESLMNSVLADQIDACLFIMEMREHDTKYGAGNQKVFQHDDERLPLGNIPEGQVVMASSEFSRLYAADSAFKAYFDALYAQRTKK